MLQLNSPAHDFFELVFTGLTEFIKDYIKDYLEFFKAISETGLIFLLCDGHSDTALNLPLILLLAIKDPVF